MCDSLRSRELFIVKKPVELLVVKLLEILEKGTFPNPAEQRANQFQFGDQGCINIHRKIRGKKLLVLARPVQGARREAPFTSVNVENAEEETRSARERNRRQVAGGAVDLSASAMAPAHEGAKHHPVKRQRTPEALNTNSFSRDSWPSSKE
eukprot:g37614.t1